jgi:hypothetical protein
MDQNIKYFLLGVLGGVFIDGMDFVKAVKSNHGVVPARYMRYGTWFGEATRLLIGGGLAGVVYASGQVDRPLAAVAIGIAAPIMIDRYAKQPPGVN